MAQTQNTQLGRAGADPFIHTIDLNRGGYLYEKFELQLSKVSSA